MDVLGEETPSSVLQSMQLGIDVNRHKVLVGLAVVMYEMSCNSCGCYLGNHHEISHCIAAIAIETLQTEPCVPGSGVDCTLGFVYALNLCIVQFEFMSQHLVFANCIPLVLKLFNQNVPIFVAAKNRFLPVLYCAISVSRFRLYFSIPALDFPRCLLCPTPELTEEGLVCCSLHTLYLISHELPELLMDAQEAGDDSEVCWRNLFSCINLLKILQKLVKWKHSRTMVLLTDLS